MYRKYPKTSRLCHGANRHTRFFSGAALDRISGPIQCSAWLKCNPHAADAGSCLTAAVATLPAATLLGPMASRPLGHWLPLPYGRGSDPLRACKRGLNAAPRIRQGTSASIKEISTPAARIMRRLRHLILCPCGHDSAPAPPLSINRAGRIDFPDIQVHSRH